MTLINLRLSQLEPSTDSEIALRSQGDNISVNVDSFEEYANSTFIEDAGYVNSVVLSEDIKYLSSSNANSAYADSNAFTILSEINSRDNLLVYLDGILQHPDQYVVDGNSLTLSNSDPLPKDISVGVRHLQISNVLISNSSAANSTIGANGTIAWNYESKRLYVYDGSTIGGYQSNAAALSSDAAWTFQGSSYGYASGQNTLKFPFTSDTSSISGLSVLTISRAASFSSEDSGYSVAGQQPSAPDANPIYSYSATINKFNYSTETWTYGIGNISQGGYRGLSGANDVTYGYSVGGMSSPSTYTSVVDQHTFSSDTDGAAVSNISSGYFAGAGCSSETNGFHIGGLGPSNSNIIFSYPFSTGTVSTYYPSFNTQGAYYIQGASSTTHGYVSGGWVSSLTAINKKFSFSSASSSVTFGNSLQTRAGASATSSESYAYFTGGNINPGALDTIEKFPFSSDSPAIDVGETASSGIDMVGFHV